MASDSIWKVCKFRRVMPSQFAVVLSSEYFQQLMRLLDLVCGSVYYFMGSTN